MARPKGGYRNAAGDRVPGASTVAKLVAETEGLNWWYYQQGLDGKDPRESKDKAASAGTMIHEAAEAWKHNQAYAWVGDPTIVEPAKIGFSAFLEWANQTKLTVEETELSLVCEHHAFGGTFDSTWVAGRRCMVDYKTSTSARVYPEALVQTAAYRHLFEDHFPDKPLDGGTYILTFHRETGDFRASWFADLTEAWEAFVACRTLYGLRERLKKRCG